jgi:hypothetical protein
LSNRYRFSDKFSVSHRLNFLPQNNNTGYAGNDGEPVLGKRDIDNIENVLNLKYSFNAMMNINVRVRHYWIKVDYEKFYTLKMDKSLVENPGFAQNVNQNLNIFNIDAVYTWQFAPGSFINLTWKNFADSFTRSVNDGYFKNFSNTIDADENNNVSFKVIYFLDYLQLKKKKKTK